MVNQSLRNGLGLNRRWNRNGTLSRSDTNSKGQTRATHHEARRTTTLQPKAEYICADLSSRPNFSPAVVPQTSHS